MCNLLKETEEVLKEHNKTFDDVDWIGCSDFKCTIENFKKIADFEYMTCTYGYQDVAIDLLIVGKGWWLERQVIEWDENGEAYECWEFKKAPICPSITVKLDALSFGQASPRNKHIHCTLAKLNGISPTKAD